MALDANFSKADLFLTALEYFIELYTVAMRIRRCPQRKNILPSMS